jgi:xylulokinase
MSDKLGYAGESLSGSDQTTIKDSSALVLGIDLGTTKIKVIAFDPKAGRVVASSESEYVTLVTADGGSEQNPEDWWSAVAATCRKLFDDIRPGRIEAVGLSGHMHGLLLLDDNLAPVRPAMTWSDRRVGSLSAELRTHSRFRELGGNDVVDAFTAPKLAWLAATDPDALSRACHLLLAKDYIALKLTGQLGTDVTDAIGTLLWDVDKGVWDDTLFSLCGSTSQIAPNVMDSSDLRGAVSSEASSETGLLVGTPVVAGAGDVSAAALGSGLIDSTLISLNAGTAAQALGSIQQLDAGDAFMFGSALGQGYLAMSSVYAAGASIRWAERILFPSQSIENLASRSDPGAEGLSYLPFMFGAVVPRKNDSARAAFVGQTGSHDARHLAAAVLEGVAFACADAIEAVAHLTGSPQRVHVVGGVANSRIWQNALSSVLEVPVLHLPVGGSALGAALLAAIGAGISTRDGALTALSRKEVVPPTPAVVDMYRKARSRFSSARDLLV